MPSRRALLHGIAVSIAMLIGSMYGCTDQEEKRMQEIRFDLGKNIVDTARESGVPNFAARDVAGFITYSVMNLPPQLPVRYTRPGFEINWQPVFGFSMDADRDRDASLPVQQASLSLNSSITSHADAQAFVERTIAQFAKGKWQRYHDPVWDVLLTGRSSILDEAGQVNETLMTIDPAYKIPAADWPSVAKSGPIWRWIGDGVLASLSIRYTEPQASTVPQYSMDLEFELLDVYVQMLARNGDQKRKEGDAKGWDSTAKYEAGKKERAERNKRLIANAVKRGDQVVGR